MKTIIIGIAGGTGSGKTTLTEKLRDHFGANEVSVLNHDSYYKRHDELPYEERCKLNYDPPDSFDTPLLYGMTEYVGRSYSERSTNYGYGGRTSTNVVIKPKKSKDSMIVPASGHVLLAEDLGGSYGYTVVIDHGAGLRSIFYGLTALDVEAGDERQDRCGRAAHRHRAHQPAPRLARPVRRAEIFLSKKASIF